MPFLELIRATDTVNDANPRQSIFVLICLITEILAGGRNVSLLYVLNIVPGHSHWRPQASFCVDDGSLFSLVSFV